MLYCSVQRALAEFLYGSNHGATLVLGNRRNYRRQISGINNIGETFFTKHFSYAVNNLRWAGWMPHDHLQHIEKLVEPHCIEDFIPILHQIFDVTRSVELVNSFQQKLGM